MNLQIIATIFFVETLVAQVNAVLRMSHDEISQMYSEFEIFDPVLHDKDGNIISTDEQNSNRLKRDLRRSEAFSRDENENYQNNLTNVNLENVYLNISAFGQNYTIVLKQKANLIAPNARIYEHAAGGVTESLLDGGNVYTGYIRSHRGSRVALTNFNGIAGYVRTEEAEFFVEPIENDEMSSRRHIIYKTFNKYGKSREKRGRRRSRKPTYTIEILVTADYTVVDFHGRDQIQSYLTTLLLIVDEIYQDESIGQNINIVLVGVTLLDAGESHNLISHERPEMNLKSVCKWAHRRHHREGGDRNALEYDQVIFLTRRSFGPHGMEGYAHVTGMCRPLRSCTLNREDGFSSAFVVAHETGHVLGMEHDGEGNKCGDETSMGSIMAPLVEAAFNRYHWSRCSGYELQGHIRKFDCLQNNPHISAADHVREREHPGVYYSLDDQCRFDFGPGYRLCTAQFVYSDVCEMLWCGHDENPSFCKTKKNPPIDGTACGEGRWCFKGICVWRNGRGGRRDGGWGEWSNYGACSRSCGTGTRNRFRQCDRPRPALGGKKCVGPSIEYGLCNTGSCPRSHDYRAEQCRHHRDVEYRHRRHTWLPYEYHHENFKCELYCESKETGVILSMGTPAADGTRCSYDDPYSVCANRKCLQVGCDGVIGSGMKEDACGVCGGNGVKECTRITKTYKKLVRRFVNSFAKVITLPFRARHVRIRESVLYPNTVLGLKNRRTGRWVFNNNRSTIEDGSEKQVIESGIKWTATMRQKKENFYTVGPLPSEYAILIMTPRDVGKIKIHYSFTLHKNDVRSKMYHYVVRKWYPCSVTCGTGVKIARYGCMNKVTKRFVRKAHCGKTAPKKFRATCIEKCNPQLRWHVSRWGQCHASPCGRRGVKNRNVTCQKQMENEVEWRTVAESDCGAHLSDKPASTKSCTKTNCLPEWVSDDWSPCSVSCGDGIKRRSVRCMLGGREGEHIKDTACLLSKPPSTISCSIPACPESECKMDNYIICRETSMRKHCSKPRYRQFCCQSCRTYDAEREFREGALTK